MADKIGAKIALDGEKEFKKAISDINNGLKVTASEMALVTARYSENSNSVSALTAKQEVLTRKQTEQAAAVQKIREALASAQTSYGDTDKRTQSWQKSLNLAEVELIKTDKELKNNSEALKKAEKDMQKYGLTTDEAAKQNKELGGIIGDLVGKMGVNLPAGADKAIAAFDKQNISTLALVGVTASLITGFGKLTVETAKAADEIMTLSKTTGLSTDTIQELEYASELVDVSVETMSGSMTRMIRSMDDARNGSKEASEGFRKLHLSVTDTNGQLKDSEEMFYQVIDALGRVKNETERDAISMQVLGKGARELNPLIEAGSQRLKELGLEAQQMGYVMDSDTLESFGKLDDAMQRFDKQTDTFKNSIALVMLPPLTALFELLNKMDPKIIATAAIIGTISVVALTVVKSIASITTVIAALSPAMMTVTLQVTGVVAALIALATIIALIVGESSRLDRAMSSVGNSVSSMTSTISGAGSRVKYSYASGIDYVPSDRVALIHKGERVQTADENPYNPDARNARSGGDTFILQVNMDQVDEVYKLVNTIKRLKQTARQGGLAYAGS